MELKSYKTFLHEKYSGENLNEAFPLIPLILGVGARLLGGAAIRGAAGAAARGVAGSAARTGVRGVAARGIRSGAGVLRSRTGSALAADAVVDSMANNNNNNAAQAEPTAETGLPPKDQSMMPRAQVPMQKTPSGVDSRHPSSNRIDPMNRLNINRVGNMR